MRSFLRCVALVALAAAGIDALAQKPERRQDAFGKLTKLTPTEIDLEILDGQGHSTQQVFTIAAYARCGTANIGAMVVVHFFTDGKGVNIAETLTVSGRDQSPPIPKPDEKQEPASVTENRPTVRLQLAPKPESTVAASGDGATGPKKQPTEEHASAAPSDDRVHPSPPSENKRKVRIAILDFDYGAVQTASSAIFGTNVDVGKGIADMLVSGLAKDGSYIIVERKQLNDVLAEQNFSNSNRADPTSAAKIGKLLGVDAIVVGTITEFGNDTKNHGLGGGGSGWTGALGGINHSKSNPNVAINARIVNIDTGEIMGVAEGLGTSSRSSTGLGGGGGSWNNNGSGAVDFGSSNFQNTIIGEATKNAVDKLSTELVADSAKIGVRTVTVEGMVAAVEGNQIVLNVGGKAGIKAGDQFNVVRVTKEIKDPATGAVIRRVSTTMGVVKATDVDDLSAVCEPVSGSGFKVGDSVKMVTQ